MALQTKKQTWVSEAIFVGADPHYGMRIWQLTSGPLAGNNIYCEQLYTSADGNRIALFRFSRPGPPELWVADLITRKTAFVTADCVSNGASGPRSDNIYFIGLKNNEEILHRLNLSTLECIELLSFKIKKGGDSLGITADEKIMIRGPVHIEGKKYGLSRIDLESGEQDVCFTCEDMCNPHLQCEPSGKNLVMVQWNRGMEIDKRGNITKIADEQSVTLFSVDVQGKNQRLFPAAPPYTAGITGHECWVSDTGRALFTTCDVFTPHGNPLGGNLYLAAPGDKAARLVLGGHALNHVSASADGKYFIADDFRGGHIHIGNIATGRQIAVCDPGLKLSRSQHYHPHAYLCPGNKWLVYNSAQSGIPHVYAGEVPDGLLSSLG